MDKRSFVMGMVTAFSECVAGGCKRLALSPPLSHSDFEEFHEEAYEIIEKHGLIHYHEENLDLPEDARFEWILITQKDQTIDEYLKIRKEHNPVHSLKPFYSVLSYDPETAISTGYDAFREYFGD